MIEQRIGQSFAFLRDVLANPWLVEKIRSGASLRHRDVVLDEAPFVVHLTAYQAPSMANWTAMVAGVDDELAWRRQRVPDWPVHRWGRLCTRVDAVGETAAAALDALEAKILRTTTEDAAALHDR
jgi:hypothetical protein